MNIENEIISTCRKQFPLVEAIFLTGSQLTKETIDKNSDIDIIILDESFSVVSSRTLQLYEYRLDLTLVPFEDLDNILSNERFDHRGTLITMLNDGKILWQRTESGTHLQERVKEIHKQTNLTATSRQNNLLQDLSRLKKLFTPNLNERERFILVSTTVDLLTEIEMTKRNNWHLGTKHKLRFFSENNDSRSFIDDLMYITSSYLKGDDESSMSHLYTFIDYYEKNFQITYFPIDDSIYIMEIGNVNINNLADFYLIANSDNILKNCDIYFLSSPTKYHRIFKIKTSLCLVFVGPDRLDKKAIYHKTLNIFANKLNIRPSISIEANLIFSDSNFSAKIWRDFTNTALEVCNMIRGGIQTNKEYDKEEAVFLMIILLGFISKKLDLSIYEVLYGNSLIQKRWLYSRDEQQLINKQDELNALGFRKTKNFDEYYKKNELEIKKCFTHGMTYSTANKSDKKYNLICVELEKFIFLMTMNPIKYTYNLSLSKLTLFKNNLNIEKTDHLLFYISLFEQLSFCLQLNEIQIGLSAFLTSGSIKSILSDKAKSQVNLS